MKSIMKKSCALILMLALLATGIGEFSGVMLAKASDTSVVTLEDGVKYVKYEDISQYRTIQDENGYYTRSPKQSGYIFGGWFAEAGEANAIGTATSGAAWAKFVPEETFTIKGQISIAAPTSGVGFSDLLTSVEKVNLRLVTGVDSLKYQKVIFQMTNSSKTLEHEMTSVMSRIDVKHEEDSTYESKNASDVFGAAAEYFATIRITGIAATADRYLKDWTITPMVVTQDGTLVKGVTREELKISDAIPFQLEGEGSDSCITADYDQRKVTVNLTDPNVRNQFFATGNATNSSKYWEITGNLKVITGHVKGFTIQSADQSKFGFYTMWSEGVSLNQNYRWPNNTSEDPWDVYYPDSTYVHSNGDYTALSGNSAEKRFKVVIKDDIFSFWVEDKLVWELPLTDERFGGFEAGTSYRFALRHLDINGKAEWSDLKVKCGQTFLVADKTSGVTADRINGTVIASGTAQTLYFAADNATNSSKNWEITGNMSQIGYGLKTITIQSTDALYADSCFK